MKNLRKPLFQLIFLLTISPFIGYAEATGAQLQFIKEHENLGKLIVSDRQLVKVEIKFSNAGDKPLIVSDVRACCGTRVIGFTRDPILTGQNGSLIVEFDLVPGYHPIERVVNIMSNDPDGMKAFLIFGEVVLK